MFWLLIVIGVCEIALILPIIYVLLTVFFYPNTAFLFACILCILPIIGGFLNRIIKKGYFYRIIAFSLAVLSGLTIAFFNIETIRLQTMASIMLFLLCFLVLELSRYDFENNAGGADVFAIAGLLINIPLALWNNIINNSISWQINALIAVSTVISIVVLILKQVDASRRFANNTMSITQAHRKNNKIFATVFIIIILLVGSFGQVSALYTLLGNIIKWILALISFFIPDGVVSKFDQQPKEMEMPQLPVEDKQDSVFDVIMQYAIMIIAIIAVLACLAFLIYKLLQFLKWLVSTIIAWLRGHEYISSYVENGHIDEKESILKKNISRTAAKLNGLVKRIFDREVPYSQLKDNAVKMRRLYKIYLKNIKKNKSGSQIIDKNKNGSQVIDKNSYNASQNNTSLDNMFASLTTGEICDLARESIPDDKDFHLFIAQCYDKARYSASVPTKEEITVIEARIKP